MDGFQHIDQFQTRGPHLEACRHEFSEFPADCKVRQKAGVDPSPGSFGHAVAPSMHRSHPLQVLVDTPTLVLDKR